MAIPQLNPYEPPIGGDEILPRLRLRIVPAVGCLLYGTVILVQMTVILTVMIWANLRFGPALSDPDRPSFHKYAFSSPRLARIGVGSVAGIASIAAGRWFWKKRWWSALIASGLVVALAGISKLLQQAAGW